MFGLPRWLLSKWMECDSVVKREGRAERNAPIKKQVDPVQIVKLPENVYHSDRLKLQCRRGVQGGEQDSRS